MRILWVKVGGLWSLNTGGRLRSFHIISELSRRHRVTLLATHGPGDIQEGLVRDSHSVRSVDVMKRLATKAHCGQRRREERPGMDHHINQRVGYLSYGPDAANVLFHVANERHLHHRPVLFTTNKPLSTWGRVLHDPDLAQANPRPGARTGTSSRAARPSYRTRHANLTLPRSRGHRYLPEFPEIT